MRVTICQHISNFAHFPVRSVLDNVVFFSQIGQSLLYIWIITQINTGMFASGFSQIIKINAC